MSTFKHYRLVTAAICVAGFLAQGNAVAGPVLGSGPLRADHCTNDGNCTLFAVNNTTDATLYIAIWDGTENCYGPNDDKYSPVAAGMQSVDYDIPDNTTCQDLDNTTSSLYLYANLTDGTPLCTYSLTTALDQASEDPSLVVFQVAGNGTTECTITG